MVLTVGCHDDPLPEGVDDGDDDDEPDVELIVEDVASELDPLCSPRPSPKPSPKASKMRAAASPAIMINFLLFRGLSAVELPAFSTSWLVVDIFTEIKGFKRMYNRALNLRLRRRNLRSCHQYRILLRLETGPQPWRRQHRLGHCSVAGRGCVFDCSLCPYYSC